MANLFIRKPLSRIIEQADAKQGNLKRSLTAFSLILLGIGAIYFGYSRTHSKMNIS